MTPDRLAEIKERAEKATPEPWVAAGALVYRWEGHRQHVAVTRYPDHEEADAEFIAHSRSDVLALLSTVEDIFTGLVAFYRRDPVFVAWLCDEQLDRSGALLGLVRERVAACTAENKEATSGN